MTRKPLFTAAGAKKLAPQTLPRKGAKIERANPARLGLKEAAIAVICTYLTAR
jgi:hypothetical protein